MNIHVFSPVCFEEDVKCWISF